MGMYHWFLMEASSAKPCSSAFLLLYLTYRQEGSHSGLVRPPAKRLGGESSLMGSNPIPSASLPCHTQSRIFQLHPRLPHTGCGSASVAVPVFEQHLRHEELRVAIFYPKRPWAVDLRLVERGTQVRSLGYVPGGAVSSHCYIFDCMRRWVPGSKFNVG